MNHDVNGSGECAQCANPDLKGLHSCDRNSMSRRLGQASSGPTFSYANGALDDEETLKRRANESAVRQALASEAKAHQWEHKQPRLTHAQADQFVRDAMGRRSRTFTREEVLTVLKSQKVDISSPIGEAVIASLIRIFERME